MTQPWTSIPTWIAKGAAERNHSLDISIELKEATTSGIAIRGS